MHKPESVPENETHNILWDIKIQTDHSILPQRPNLVIINKKRTKNLVDFYVLTEHRAKIKEDEKIIKYLDLARELKKL